LPRAEQPFYSEHIVHLACCYQANDPARRVGPRPARANQGLPETGLVFCCFNNHAKITQPIFDIWMRLLKALPDSTLWLLDGHASDTLRYEARARGIDPRRLIFAPLVNQEAHLARLGLADLVLDTLPYNAHTTASDALWAGVPLVTCRGKAFAGRVAASLLSAMDLPELITQDLTSYEALALKLARDDVFRDALRDKLVANRDKNSLFDAAKFRRNIESAFSTMIDKARRGEAPSGFDVAV
jgi:predicted O-linked N-acetylglucosamine transferase (SPINDLY family)